MCESKEKSSVNELERSNVPWLHVDEANQRLRETGRLERVCSVKPNPPQRGVQGRQALLHLQVEFLALLRQEAEL